MRGVGTEHDRFGLGLAATPGRRAAESAVAEVRPESGVGVHDPFDHVLGGLRTEPAGLEIAVAQRPQGRFAAAEPELPEGHGRDLVSGGVDSVQGVGQRR
ncbi:hypothetical protein, partial [Actinomadura darangshiensis]|uniref:hypothetical protein n=1 Tax=Actinomadura darangshiensis TaxID=705336 RepID=UPI003C7CB9C4